MVRRLVAAGVGIVVLLLVVLLFRGCLSSRKENAMREYVQDVSGLVRESDQESRNLFRTLSAPADAKDVDIQNRLNTFRGQGEQILDRAEALDTPDELKGAQSYLTEALKFRRDGVTAIARDLPRASADQGDRRQGIEQVAASMQNFLASDVIYQTRFAPSLRGALDDEDLGGEQVPRSRFLPEPDWVLPATVGERIPKLGGSGADDKEAAPGLHGTGVASATLGGQTLNPGGAGRQHPPLRRPDDDGPGRQPGREHRGGRPRGGHDRPRRRRRPGREDAGHHRRGRDQAGRDPHHRPAADRPERADHRDRGQGAGRGEARQQQGLVLRDLHAGSVTARGRTELDRGHRRPGRGRASA